MEIVVEPSADKDAVELDSASLTVTWRCSARTPKALDWRVLWYALHIPEYLRAHPDVLKSLGASGDSEPPSPTSLWAQYFTVTVAREIERIGAVLLAREAAEAGASEPTVSDIIKRQFCLSDSILQMVDLGWNDHVDAFRAWCNSNHPFRKRRA